MEQSVAAGAVRIEFKNIQGIVVVWRRTATQFEDFKVGLVMEYYTRFDDFLVGDDVLIAFRS